jgi:Anti-sigma-K factor rskA.
MKENEFDIYVRDLMAGAEESVSPEVWKGVEAGLDKAARKRVVPVWVWRSVAGVAAAAAVVAAVVLTGPEKEINLSNQPTIQTPVALATDVSLPAETRPEGDDVTPSPSRLPSFAARLPRRRTS